MIERIQYYSKEMHTCEIIANHPQEEENLSRIVEEDDDSEVNGDSKKAADLSIENNTSSPI